MPPTRTVNNAISTYLAKNVKALRNLKNYSQSQLAEVAGLPRTTVTNLESGSSNPSLSNLVKLSQALGVGLEELVSKPRPKVTLIPNDQVPVQMKNQKRIAVRKLLPDKLNGVEFDHMEFEAQAILPGHPHLEGTKEYFSVLSGEIRVHIEGESYVVKKGDVLAFEGNQAHSYQNIKNTRALAVSMVIPIIGHYKETFDALFTEIGPGTY